MDAKENTYKEAVKKASQLKCANCGEKLKDKIIEDQGKWVTDCPICKITNII